MTANTEGAFCVMSGKPGSGLVDVTGQRFGSLVVISFVGIEKHKAKWLCKCDCGGETIAIGNNLRRGISKSCGCQKHRSGEGNPNFRHGGRKGTNALYTLWNNIKIRCNNPHYPHYKDYGARGIKFFVPWERDFITFRDYILDNLGPRPSPDYSLDRIDNDRGYEPGNIRWATKSQQAQNSRPYLKKHKE